MEHHECWSNCRDSLAGETENYKDGFLARKLFFFEDARQRNISLSFQIAGHAIVINSFTKNGDSCSSTTGGTVDNLSRTPSVT